MMNNEVLNFLKTRRSVKPRDMTGPGPSPAELETILTIGARVPDHGKITPWRFIVFEGDARQKAGEVIAQIYARKNPDAGERDLDKARGSLTDAPLVVAVVSSLKSHPKVPPWEQQLSAGASALSIALAANALGYGTNWLTGWFAYDRDVLNALGLAPEEHIVGFVHIGHAAHKPEDRPRPDLSQLVTRFG